MTGKIQLTYTFDNDADLRAHLAAGDTRAAEQAGALARLAGSTAGDEPGIAADRSAVDGDGMPYDAAVHSDPPSFTTKGLWKSQRGKATEADAARAAFKARGGNVAVPVTAPAAVVTAPAAAMPGMPVLPVAAAPVSMDQVIAAAGAAQARGVSVERISGVYSVIGLTDVAQFDTNETMRAAFVTEVNKLV